MQWLNKDDAAFTKGLTFTYDEANRLLGSAGLMGYADIESGIGYDKNGNIKTLIRAGAVVDNLAYAYLGNRLSAVTDASGSNLGVKNGISNYGYDANGNMISDGNRNATLTYNYLNLPKTVTIGGKTLTYDYDAAGTKHKYIADTVTFKYAGAFEYRQIGATNVLDRVALSEGQAVFRKNALKFEYSLKDHLGNVRVVFDEFGQVLQRTDYYPFGLEIDRNIPIQTTVARNAVNRYLFNGIERQPETGIYQARFRGLDPTIGRWMQVDPKPDQSMSPYTAMNNNPLRFSDPLGDTIIVNKTGYISSNDKKDNLVFMQGSKGKLTQLGELGKKINANEIYKNLLKQNSKEAEAIYNPLTFRNLVKARGEWDYKVNKKTIYGLGNDGKTQFSFEGKSMESQDIGNHHFGVVSGAYGFDEQFSLRQAGAAQMMVPGNSKPEWRVYGPPEITGYNSAGAIFTKPYLPPYGDDPRDQANIKEGYEYYNKIKND
jgi:RHS repeat-associated protein